MSDLEVGNEVDLRLTVLSAGEPADPTDLSLEIKPPTADLYTLTYPDGGISQDISTGKFIATILGDVAGVWKFRWVGTGVATGASSGSFQITPGTIRG